MKIRTIALFVLLVSAVVGSSFISAKLWEGKQEAPPAKTQVTISESMTLSQAAAVYKLNPKSLKRPFGLSSPSDLDKTIGELGLTASEAKEKLHKASVLAAEESSKNWFKIPLKFALWLVFLIFAFKMLRRGAVTASMRKKLLAVAVLVFGVILGADPSPMGTIRDAIVLWGKEHVIFPPRLVAFGVFTLSVILANKFICSWGCQFGALQDLIFRLNRNESYTSDIIRQWKLPFALTNSIRILFFGAFCYFALATGTDIISPIGPFKVFNPASFGITGAALVAMILIASLFIYRPWCHCFCPFGLASWLFEKISINKIRVNRNTCKSCGECAKACPSTAMEAILKGSKTLPDCFSCGCCQEVCPTKSISFRSYKEER